MDVHSYIFTPFIYTLAIHHMHMSNDNIEGESDEIHRHSKRDLRMMF